MPALAFAALAGADLVAAALAGAALASAALAGADLVAAAFAGAASVAFAGADLAGADLVAAALAGADLIAVAGSDFAGGGLGGADVAGVDLGAVDRPAADLVAEDLADVDFVAVEPDAPGRVSVGLVEAAFVFAPLEAPSDRRALVDSRTPASAVELRAGMLAVVCRRVFDVAAATRSPAGFTSAGRRTQVLGRRTLTVPAACVDSISPDGRTVLTGRARPRRQTHRPGAQNWPAVARRETGERTARPARAPKQPAQDARRPALPIVRRAGRSPSCGPRWTDPQRRPEGLRNLLSPLP